MACDRCGAPADAARPAIGGGGAAAGRSAARLCRGRVVRLAVAVASGLALAALPKCPLCLVAYVSAIGAGAASLAGAVYPAAGLAIAVALAVIAARCGAARRGRRAQGGPGARARGFWRRSIASTFGGREDLARR